MTLKVTTYIEFKLFKSKKLFSAFIQLNPDMTGDFFSKNKIYTLHLNLFFVDYCLILCIEVVGLHDMCTL